MRETITTELLRRLQQAPWSAKTPSDEPMGCWRRAVASLLDSPTASRPEGCGISPLPPAAPVPTEYSEHLAALRFAPSGGYRPGQARLSRDEQRFCHAQRVRRDVGGMRLIQ